MANRLIRCSWCGEDEGYQSYHDHEWGIPCRDDKKLFEFLLLESAQAGLSWLTILRKRDNYRRAFANFDVEAVAAFGEAEIECLMNNRGIVRNQLKVKSAITNARCYLDIQAEMGSFSDYLWGFVNGKPIVNRWASEDQIPISTELSDRICKDMKVRGFKFFGTTICYAYLQAMGVVNDHIVDCFRYSAGR